MSLYLGYIRANLRLCLFSLPSPLTPSPRSQVASLFPKRHLTNEIRQLVGDPDAEAVATLFDFVDVFGWNFGSSLFMMNADSNSSQEPSLEEMSHRYSVLVGFLSKGWELFGSKRNPTWLGLLESAGYSITETKTVTKGRSYSKTELSRVGREKSDTTVFNSYSNLHRELTRTEVFLEKTKARFPDFVSRFSRSLLLKLYFRSSSSVQMDSLYCSLGAMLSRSLRPPPLLR